MLIFFLLVSFVYYSDGCDCFIKDSNKKADSTFVFSNGDKISICDYYDNEKLEGIYIIYNCKKDSVLTIFRQDKRSVSPLVINFNNDSLTLTENTYLPFGRNWVWQNVKYSKMVVYLSEGDIKFTERNVSIEESNCSEQQVKEFLQEIENSKGREQPEYLDDQIGKLTVLALDGNKVALNYLINFTKITGWTLGGAYSQFQMESLGVIKFVLQDSTIPCEHWELYPEFYKDGRDYPGKENNK